MLTILLESLLSKGIQTQNRSSLKSDRESLPRPEIEPVPLLLKRMYHYATAVMINDYNVSQMYLNCLPISKLLLVVYGVTGGR